MNIKEAIKSLESQRDQLSGKMKEDAANLKKLKETIRKLTKKAAEVDELLDSTPILDETK
jgi:prefoldin subunit 5